MSDLELRIERLLGKIQAFEVQKSRFEADMSEGEKRFSHSQAQYVAMKKCSENIEGLHAALDKEAVESSETAHKWIDKAKAQADGILSSLDTEMKMAKGVLLYIQMQTRQVQEQLDVLKSEHQKLLDSKESDARLVGTPPEPTIKKSRKSKS
jgi:chromosome segregation ATPase